MKKILFVLSLLAIFAIGNAQRTRVGLFSPVPTNLFTYAESADNGLIKASNGTSVWIPRFTAGIVANQFTYNTATKNLDMSAFSKVGMGISYAHYVPVNDLPYNNFSLNGFVLFPVQDESGFSLALTVSALQYINIGAGYDFGFKKVFGLTGLVYTF
jgi:hypothetical protein